MKNAHLLLLTCALVLFAGAAVANSVRVRVRAPDPPSVLVPSDDLRDMVTDELDSVVYETITKWPPPEPSVPQADLARVSSNIARVAREEGSIWGGDGRDVADLRKTTILMGGIGFFEGARFAQYVGDGSCNRWMAEAWKHPIRYVRPDRTILWEPGIRDLPEEQRHLLAHGHCDGGHAYGFGQVHELTWRDPSGARVEVFDAKRLLDPVENWRAVLLIARASFQQRGNLSGYTGEWSYQPESKSWVGPAPKAEQRLRFAQRWWDVPLP